MRVECESCHELVAASFAIDGEAVRSTCPACAHVMTAPLAPPRTSDAPACPKCGTERRAGATACATCGLTTDRMAAYRDARDAAIPEPLREAWDRAAAAWSEPARHDEVLRLVATHNAYAWAAARYRGHGPGDVATRQLDRLRRAAEATLFASATVKPEARPYRATVGLLAVLIVAIVVGLIYTTVARESSRLSGPPIAPGATSSPARPLVPGRPVTSSHPGGSQ